MITFSRAAYTALAVLCVSAPALAETTDKPQLHVAYTDLDLRTEAGAQILEKRVENAARKLCGNGSRDLRQNMLERRCQAEARRSADQDVAMIVRRARGEDALAQFGSDGEASR